MNALRHRLRPLAWAVLAATALAPACAQAMTVQPVVIDLTTTGREMSNVIVVENTFERPLAVELSVQALALTPDGIEETGEDTGELAVFPPQATIQPGAQQSFRVQYVGEPDLTRSKHFYVTVAQLPVQTSEGGSNIQLLYNFQVLVSVSAAGARPAITITSAQIGRNADGAPVPVVEVQNASAAHGYLSRGQLQVIEQDAGGREIFRQDMSGPQIQQSIGYGLIGGGQTRRITLPTPLPAADGTVTVRYTPAS